MMANRKNTDQSRKVLELIYNNTYVQNINKGAEIDIDWLNNQPVKQATKFIRWIVLEDPLHIRIDGSTGEGLILKPQPQLTEAMDERESTGI